jgi:integrase
MRYVKVITGKDGKKKYKFTPPKKAVIAGIVKPKTFDDGRTARYEVPRLIELVDEWKKGIRKSGNVTTSSTLSTIFDRMINTEQHRVLSSTTQKSYETAIPNLLSSKTKHGKELGNVKIKDLTAIMCAEVYDSWVKDRGVAWANRSATLFGVLVNYASSLDLIPANPMAKVKKLSHTPRSEIWTNGQVEKFLETAFSDFKYRSIGLLALLCYEWAQRPRDIANLRWESVDLVGASVTITQTKRGATVYLPIAEHLQPVLRQQNEDLGFQPWVLPDINRPTGGYEPMTSYTQSVLTREVKAKAGLPNKLQIGDLRKSAITEMVSSGVPTTTIMSVSGHKSIVSLNPYLKNTLEAATSALEQRRKK